MTTTIGSLFSGIGGLDLGVEMAVPGARVAWQAEVDPNARAVLARWWPRARCYADVRDVDGAAKRVDVICGGFPCQDISLAGAGAGIDGPKSGLWAEYARVVRDLRPSLVFVENVAALLGRGLDRVLGDLAALRYDAEWETFLASDVGAPHRRDRLFVLAYTDRERVRQLAERDQREGRRAREAERGDAEPVHDRAQLADPEGERRGSWPGRIRSPGRRSVFGDDRNWEAMSMPNSVRLPERTPWLGEQRVSNSQSVSAEVSRMSGSQCDVRSDVADPVRSGQRPRERDLRTGKSDLDGGSERELLADADGAGRSLVRIGSLLDGERPARGDDLDRRHGAHRFPPGPAAIAGWDGPQPAVRRGDDGVPGRSHRLRLLGNAVVPQQAALAWKVLVRRVLE